MPVVLDTLALPAAAPRAGLRFRTRASDSPWIDTVWTCTSNHVTGMTSVAAVCWGLVFHERDGAAYASVTGPETRTATAPVPEGAMFVGIYFLLAALVQGVLARRAGRSFADGEVLTAIRSVHWSGWPGACGRCSAASPPSAWA